MTGTYESVNTDDINALAKKLKGENNADDVQEFYRQLSAYAWKLLSGRFWIRDAGHTIQKIGHILDRPPKSITPILHRIQSIFEDQKSQYISR